MDKMVNGDKKTQDYFTARIDKGLTFYKSNITRIEVHVSDQNGIKEGKSTILCLLEAQLEGRQPITVSCQDGSIELAISGAIERVTSGFINYTWTFKEPLNGTHTGCEFLF